MKNLNPKIKKSERNYEGILKNYPQVFGSAPDGVVITDSKGFILECNIAEQELIGYDYEEIVGKHITTFHTDKYKSLFKKKLLAIQKEGNVEAELEIVHKNGNIIPIWRKGTPIRDENGNILNIITFSRDISNIKEAEQKLKKLNIELEQKVEERTEELKKSEEKYREAYNQAIVRDITKHKLAEQRLKESEEKYKLLSGITSDYIYEWNIETDELEWYGGFDEALGYKKGGIPRTIEAWVSRIHPEDQKKLKNAVEIHRKSINPIYEEYRIQKKDGKWLYWIDHGVPIVRDGKPIKWIGGCKDITGRKKAEQKLIESEEKLRDLNKILEQKVEERTRKLKKAYNRAEFYKDLFAHDMNNNLQAILSSVDLASLLLKNQNNILKVEDLIDKVKMFVGDGARLISDVKKLSKLEKEDQISIHSIEVLAILKNVIEFSQNQNQDKEVNVEIETSYEKVIVQVNELMYDVFENIMLNAVKHNKNSVVEIMIRISKMKKDGMKHYKFNFIDNGMGISDDRKEKIFQRGFMEDKSLRGMGLGLSLVKKIIDSYNGQIWVEDKVQGDHSKGSNFIILIPEGGE